MQVNETGLSTLLKPNIVLGSEQHLTCDVLQRPTSRFDLA